MSDELTVFPVAIGDYLHHDQLDVDPEVARVVELFTEFGGQEVPWAIGMPDRGGDAVAERLHTWSSTPHGNTVLYWVGHGWSDTRIASLAHAFSPKDIAEDGLPPDKLAYHITKWGHSSSGDCWAIVIVDACQSARFVERLNAAIDDRQGPRKLLLVGVSGKGATTLGRFTAALDEALHGSFLGASKIELWQLGGELKRKLDGGQVIPKDVEHEMLRRVVAPMAAPAPLDVFTELKRVLAGLTEDERGHFVPKAQGAELGELWWYFQGRRVESRRIAGWLRSARAGLLVVTGRAGSGKSALLGHSVVQSRPVVRAVLARHRLADELPPDDRPPDDVFDAVLHLAGLTSVEVTRRLAEDLRLPELKPEAGLPEQVEALRSGIKSGMETRTILVDALDEAVAPVTIARAVLRPLAALQNLRVVVGTRRSTREDPDKGEPEDQDLLDALGAADDEIIVVERDSAAITGYVRQRLDTAISRGILVADDDVVRNVGAAIGTSGQEFLFARLAVHEILARPALLTGPGLAELVSSDHRGLFARAVSRLEAERAANGPLLAALAFARGRGVPMRDGVWATVASALSGGPVITDAEIGDLRKVAAPYVMLDREHGQSVYRLAHRTFAEHFTHELDKTSDAQEEDRRRHQDILRGLVAEVARSPAIGLNPYLSSYLSAHAGAAGREGWQYLADHPDVLHRLDPEAVSADVMRTAFGRVELPPEITGMVGVRDLLSKGTVTDHPGLRQLAIARYTGVRQARTDPRMPDGAEWAVRWADLVQQTLHVTLTRDRRHDGGVWAVTAVPGPGGRTLLATGGGDGTVRLWNPATCTEVGKPLRGDTSRVTAVTAVPGPGGRTLLATGGEDGVVRLWDPATSTEMRQPLSGHTSRVTAIAVLAGPGGRTLLATGSWDGVVRLWDPATSTETGQPLSGHTSRVTAIAVLPGPGGRTLLATGSEDGKVRLWDPTTSTEMSKPLRGQARSVDAVAAVPGPGGCTLLATGGEDGVVRLWDPATGTEMGQPLSGHTSGVTVVAALPGPSGRTLLASGSSDGTLRLWDPTSVATGGGNATARRWDRRWLSRRPLASHAGEVRAVAAVPGPDGQTLLASGGSDGTVRLWDPTSGTPIGQPLTGHIDQVKGIVAVIGSGGRPLIVSSSDDGTMRLWDPATGRCIRRRPTDDAGSVNAVATVSVSSGRTLLAAGYGDGRVRLWDGRKRRSRRSLAGHAGQVYAVAAVGGPDGQSLLASGGEEGTVRLWNPANGTAVADPMPGHTDQVNGVAAVPGPSGRSLLASGSSDRTVRLWEATGTPAGQPLTGHAGGVNAVAALLCPDGRTLLASGSSDGTVRLWDPATGALVTVLAVGMIVWAISPMPGGHLAIGTDEGIAVLRVRELLSG